MLHDPFTVTLPSKLMLLKRTLSMRVFNKILQTILKVMHMCFPMI